MAGQSINLRAQQIELQKNSTAEQAEQAEPAGTGSAAGSLLLEQTD
jgi:hypothetical protein